MLTRAIGCGKNQDTTKLQHLEDPEPPGYFFFE